MRLLASIAVLLMLTLPVLGQDLADDLAGNNAQRYQQAMTRLEQLRGATDLASKLELAKLLAAGIPAGPDNPIRKPDTRAADALLEDVIAGDNVILRQQALELRANILSHSTLVSDIEKGKAIIQQLAAEGYAPSLAAYVLAGGGLPEGLTLEQASASLTPRILSGDSDAAFAMARLVETSDPRRAGVLRNQALVFLTVQSRNSVSAATELGRRYLVGDGVAQDQARAMELFKLAVRDGANAPLTILNQAVIAGTPGLDLAQIRTLIITALAAGSTKAAELIAQDAMGRPLYGFTAADAQYAISLMAQIGDRSALLLAVKAIVRGLNGAPDVQQAVPYIEELVKVDGLQPAAILDLGDDLERLNLPIPVALKYIEPMYRKVTGPQRDEAVFRADRLLATAAENGVLTAAQLGQKRIAEIIAELKDNAGRNHTRSLILLGDIYYAGLWVPINNRQAMQYYDQSLALEPSDVARERLAKALMLAKASPFEEKRYRELIEQLSVSGSLWGKYRMGVLLIEDPQSTSEDVAAGEAILFDLSSRAYPAAVRALLKHLKGVNDESRIDQAVQAFTQAWALNKDVRIGRLLGEFYVIAGRLDEARGVLQDPIFARDIAATLALAQIEAGAAPPQPKRALELARHGLELAKDDQAAQLDFIHILQGLPLAEAKALADQNLMSLADANNVDAVSALIPDYIARIETDPEALPTVLKWSETLAGAGAEGPILQLARQYLVPNADQAIATSVLDAAARSLAVLPPDTYLAVQVADAYLGGFGTARDVARGNALIETSAAAGNKDGLAELGMQFYYGLGRPRDPNAALLLLDSAAALGSNTARVEVGRLYSSSTGPRVDMLKAFSMFLAAAEDGSTAGMLEVGRLFLAGWGTAQDEEKGVDWLERAAELGNTDAMYLLYFHYLSKADPALEETAMSWLRRSADAGVDPARLRLAGHLLNEDRTGNYEEAMKMLDEAYASGFNLAGRFKRAILASGGPGPGAEASP